MYRFIVVSLVLTGISVAFGFYGTRIQSPASGELFLWGIVLLGVAVLGLSLAGGRDD